MTHKGTGTNDKDQVQEVKEVEDTWKNSQSVVHIRARPSGNKRGGKQVLESQGVCKF